MDKELQEWSDRKIAEYRETHPEPKKPKKFLPGWLKAIIVIALALGGVALIFQVNPVCGVALLFFVLPIMSNL